MTPNRSAGRIEDPLWLAFLGKARRLGLSNTDGMREALGDWCRKPDPPTVHSPAPPGPEGAS